MNPVVHLLPVAAQQLVCALSRFDHKYKVRLLRQAFALWEMCQKKKNRLGNYKLWLFVLMRRKGVCVLATRQTDSPTKSTNIKTNKQKQTNKQTHTHTDHIDGRTLLQVDDALGGLHLCRGRLRFKVFETWLARWCLRASGTCIRKRLKARNNRGGFFSLHIKRIKSKRRNES